MLVLTRLWGFSCGSEIEVQALDADAHQGMAYVESRRALIG